MLVPIIKIFNAMNYYSSAKYPFILICELNGVHTAKCNNETFTPFAGKI